jgi:hypothetical protein
MKNGNPWPWLRSSASIFFLFLAQKTPPQRGYE